MISFAKKLPAGCAAAILTFAVPLASAQAPIATPEAAPAPVSAAAPAGQPQPAQPDFSAQHAAIDNRKAWAEYRYREAEYKCYDKFFVNACIDSARDKRHTELKAIRVKELALDDAERRARAQAREQRMAGKRAQDAAEAPAREAEQKQNAADYAAKQAEHQRRVTERTGEAPQRAANAQAYGQKQAEHQQKLDEARAAAQQNAAERAQNVKKYEQKQKDAAAREKQLEERRAKARDKSGQQKGIMGQ